VLLSYAADEPAAPVAADSDVMLLRDVAALDADAAASDAFVVLIPA
jgi:hypothetical protein